MSAVDEARADPPAADLPWPPPGLEQLEGALEVPLRRATTASLLLVLAVLWALSSTEPLAIGGVGLVFLLIATGLVFFLGAILRTAGVIDQSRRAMLLGYSRSLVAEVACDVDRRAAPLALELEPYASVPPEARAQARRLRVGSITIALIGALITPVMLAIAVLLAVRSDLPLIAAIAIALMPGVLLALPAAAMRFWSVTLLQWSRSAGAWDPSPVSLQDRVDAWRARFAPGQTAQRPGLLPLVLASIGGILMFVFVLVMLSLPVLLALRGGSVGSEFALGRVQAPSRQRVDVVRSYRLPADSSIDALQAGAALYDIAQVGVPERYERTPVPPYVEQPWLTGLRTRNLPERALFTAAFGTGSAALRDSLQHVRSHPADSLIALVARAPAADVVGALHGSTPSATPAYTDLSFARRTLRELAQARSARAGFLAAEGRAAHAELLLREVASVAVLLHDEAPTNIDALFAGVAAASAAQGLAALYEHTGRADQAAALLRDIRASEIAARQRASRSMSRTLRQTIADSTAPQYVRWEALSTYALLQRCRHPRAAVFDRWSSAELDEMRTHLVRRPSDTLVFDRITDIPLENLDRGVPRMVRRALTAVMGPPSEANLCLWGGTFF